MPENVNILFTSAGRRVELLRWFRRAYAEAGLGGRMIATDIDPLAPALQIVDGHYLVPRLTDPGYVDALVEVVEREAIDVIVPLIDPDIVVLARHRDALESTGARVLALDEQGAEATADKLLTFELFSSLGVPTPRTWRPDETGGEVSFPVVVKPRRGSAGADVFVARNDRELEFFVEYVDDPVVQEFLPGPEITTDVFCDFSGAVLGAVSRRRIEVRSGEVAKGVTVYDPVVIDHCATIAKALETVGPITVQCMLRDDEPFFTEVNARFGGGVPLGVAAGVTMPHWLLALAAGRQVDVPPLGSYRTGLYLSRFDDSFIFSEEDHEAIARRRL